jgi:hypothetical protein
MGGGRNKDALLAGKSDNGHAMLQQTLHRAPFPTSDIQHIQI